MREIRYQTKERPCPLCGGLGKIMSAHFKYTQEQRETARKLYANGVSLREIADKIGVEGSGKAQKVKSLIMSIRF